MQSQVSLRLSFRRNLVLITAFVPLTLLPALALPFQLSAKGSTISLQLQPSALPGGATSAATVILSAKAPKTGATVTLKSSSTTVKVPATVKIPAGAKSASFTAKTSTVTSTVSALITATYKINTVTTTLTVEPSLSSSHYTPSTLVLDLACARRAIEGVSHDGLALVLDSAAPCVSSVAKGKVLLFKKLGVVKALGTAKGPQNQLAVAISPAAFTDFIQDGTFQIFSQQLGSASMPSGFGDSAGEPSETGPDQWKYNVHGSGGGSGAVQYSFTASKEIEGLKARVDGSGHAQGGYNFLAVIHGDQLQTVKYTTPTEGKLHVTWAVQSSEANKGIGESRLRLPPLWSSLVDSADDVPLLFQVYANLIFKPGFGEKKFAATGAFDVNYGGEGGFDTSQPLNEGLTAQAEPQKVTSTALAAHGVVVAVNAPKFVLSLSTDSFVQALAIRDSKALAGAGEADSMEKLVKQFFVPVTGNGDFFKINRAAYVMWVTSIGYAGPGSVSMLPCEQFYETFVASAGADKKMLGTNANGPGDNLTIFKDGKTVVDPDIPVCRPKS